MHWKIGIDSVYCHKDKMSQICHVKIIKKPETLIYKRNQVLSGDLDWIQP
jgi:hypothetical protein